MNVGTPKSVMALSGKFAYPNDASETPDTLQTVYEYDGFSILWEHAIGIDGGNYGRNHGIVFIGNSEMLVVDRVGWEVITETEFQGWGKGGIPKIEAVSRSKRDFSESATQNFIVAIKSRDSSKMNAPIKVGYDALWFRIWAI